MRSRNGLLACLVVLGLSCAASPATGGDSPTPCASATSQAELTACWGAESRAAIVKVNSALMRVEKRLTSKSMSEAVTLLGATQEKWSAYMDATCRFEAALFDGGSMAVTTESICRHRVARARESDLTRLEKELSER